MADNDELPHKLIHDAQLELLFSEKAEIYTDAKVTCRGLEWKVQQSILSPRCPFFEACFRAGSFKEGETKTVDFKDDEPYVIEALLIYLYTFEYPNRKSYKFKEPGRRAAQKMKSKEGVSTRPPSKQETLNSTGFKLKSFAPKETWQEHLAIYHIAHRMNLQSLCKTSLAVLTAHVESALGSASVAHFLKEIYSLPSDKTEGIRKAVANKIANEVPRPIPPTTFDRAMLDHHLFKYDLIKALRQKDLQQRDKIAEQEKKIRAVQQIVSDNWSVKRTYNALIFLTSGWPKAEQS